MLGIWIGISVVLCLIGICDGREKRISNRLLGVLLVGVMVEIVVECLGGRSSIQGVGGLQGLQLMNRMMGALLVSGILLLCRLKAGAFGYGDVKLMAVSGLLLGLPKNLLAFAVGILTAGIWCLGGMILGRYTRKSEIPFGPFLAVGIGIAIWFGDALIGWFVAG